MYNDVDSQDNSSCASDKSWDMKKDGGQEDDKNIVYNDNMEQDEINDLNEDLLHLRNGLGDNINDANNGNNHNSTNLANNGLKSNNTLGAHIVEEKEGWFYEWADTYDEWNNYYHTPTKENEPGSSHMFTGDDSIFKLTKTKHNGKSKTRLVSEVSTSVKSDFYIGERQK